MDIATLLTNYFVQVGDASPPIEPVPSTFSDCLITPLIDCVEFNAAIVDALTLATGSGDFVLIANWWLGLQGGEYAAPPTALSSTGPGVTKVSPYTLDGPGGTIVLGEELKKKARA